MKLVTAGRDPVLVWKRASTLALAVTFSLLALGVVHGLWSESLHIEGMVATGNFNADFKDAWTDDDNVMHDEVTDFHDDGSCGIGSGSCDPREAGEEDKDNDTHRYDKAVAECKVELFAGPETHENPDQMTLARVTITNAYPSYVCNIYLVLENGGDVPEHFVSTEIMVDDELELDVIPLLDVVGIVLDPGDTVLQIVSVHVRQEALELDTYTFTIWNQFELWNTRVQTGTIGFWKNWDAHNKFDEFDDIVPWLLAIDASTQWYGDPLNPDEALKTPALATTDHMVTILTNGLGWWTPMGDRFLAQCLASRLNGYAQIIPAGELHPLNGETQLYLVLPASANLADILAAIEAKFVLPPTDLDFPTKPQFEIMKNVCDDLNNRVI